MRRSSRKKTGPDDFEERFAEFRSSTGSALSQAQFDQDEEGSEPEEERVCHGFFPEQLSAMGLRDSGVH